VCLEDACRFLGQKKKRGGSNNVGSMQGGGLEKGGRGGGKWRKKDPAGLKESIIELDGF